MKPISIEINILKEMDLVVDDNNLLYAQRLYRQMSSPGALIAALTTCGENKDDICGKQC
jgi:hypothetical protein